MDRERDWEGGNWMSKSKERGIWERYSLTERENTSDRAREKERIPMQKERQKDEASQLCKKNMLKFRCCLVQPSMQNLRAIFRQNIVDCSLLSLENLINVFARFESIWLNFCLFSLSLVRFIQAMQDKRARIAWPQEGGPNNTKKIDLRGRLPSWITVSLREGYILLSSHRCGVSDNPLLLMLWSSNLHSDTMLWHKYGGAPKERRRRRAEKRLSKRVFLESPFLLCPL